MASHYTPVAGNIEVVDGFNEVKKYYLPTASRSFPAGCPVWTNGAYGVEPSLIPAVAGATVSGASTFTSVELANAAFAPLFAGFSIGARVSQQLNSLGGYSVAAPYTAANQDASQPFISVADAGIASAPYWDGTNSTVTAQLEIGTLVDLSGFANEASAGFYGADGTLQTDTKTYLYMNSVQVTTTAANAIGVVCERALVGDSRVKFKFESATLNPANVL